MTAKNVRVEELTAAAVAVGVRIENHRTLNHVGTRHAFVLRLGTGRLYQRMSPSGRRVAAVCWHGHAAFFRELFRTVPGAVVTSRWAAGKVTYTADTFEDTFRRTGYVNIGSQMNPMAYEDACDFDTHPINMPKGDPRIAGVAWFNTGKERIVS